MGDSSAASRKAGFAFSSFFEYNPGYAFSLPGESDWTAMDYCDYRTLLCPRCMLPVSRVTRYTASYYDPHFRHVCGFEGVLRWARPARPSRVMRPAGEEQVSAGRPMVRSDGSVAPLGRKGKKLSRPTDGSGKGSGIQRGLTPKAVAARTPGRRATATGRAAGKEGLKTKRLEPQPRTVKERSPRESTSRTKGRVTSLRKRGVGGEAELRKREGTKRLKEASLSSTVRGRKIEAGAKGRVPAKVRPRGPKKTATASRQAKPVSISGKKPPVKVSGTTRGARAQGKDGQRAAAKGLRNPASLKAVAAPARGPAQPKGKSQSGRTGASAQVTQRKGTPVRRRAA